MGAAATSVSQTLSKEEVCTLAREQWDEAKWEGLEKDDEGRVKLTAIIALAEDAKKAEVKAEAEQAAAGQEQQMPCRTVLDAMPHGHGNRNARNAQERRPSWAGRTSTATRQTTSRFFTAFLRGLIVLYVVLDYSLSNP